ncbi:MAG: bifunctional nuclease family protein [Acidimicrobiales bacterium]
MVSVTVCEVRSAIPAGPGVEAGLVVLQEQEGLRRMLRIVIGQPEARAIQAAWNASVPARPSTWDLFLTAIETLNGDLVRATITAVEDGRHFFATIDIRRGSVTHQIDCRASDAIALALRCPDAEIVVAEEVLAAAGVDPEVPGP